LDNANGFQYIAQLGLASQAAAMLRQQQAEIEELKKQLAFMEGEYPEPTIMAKMMEVDLVRQQQAELDRAVELYTDKAIENEALKQIIDANNLNQNIGQFVKPTNEPVAWAFMLDGDFWDAIHPDEHAQEEGSYTIPLYTHPVKEQITKENHVWDRGIWTVGQTESQEFIESSDFNHDVRLYLNGDFEDDTQRLNYLQHIADRLNTHPVKELSRMDVYELAIESGFMLSTQYGEAEHKLMPVSDGDTLVKLARAILRKAQEK